MANHSVIDGSGIVVNVISIDPDHVETYAPGEGLSLVTEPGGKIGDTWNGSAFITPAGPLPSIGELKAYAAKRRYEIQSSGVVSQTYGPLLTDRDTTSIIAQAIQSIDLGITTDPINFKTPSGFFPLMRSDLVAISVEIVAHVQSCFDAEGEVAAAIDAMTITTIAEIDAAFSAI